jgi:molecular chaperone GrpE
MSDERDADFSKAEEQEDANTAAPLSDAELIESLQAELAETRDKYLRALADTDNIRKRAVKERSELLKYQGERLIIDMLDVIDDFELAMGQSGTDIDKFKAGIELIHKRLLSIFEKWEIKGEVGVGQPFDPAKHDAISRVAAPAAAPGSVVSELKRAFFYKDRLLRPAVVVVAAEPAVQDSSSNDSIDLSGETLGEG